MLELHSGGGFVDFLPAWSGAFEEVLNDLRLGDYAPRRERFGEQRRGRVQEMAEGWWEEGAARTQERDEGGHCGGAMCVVTL